MWMTYNKKVLEFYYQHHDQCLLASTNFVIQDPANLVEKIDRKLDICLASPDLSIYEARLFRREADSYHRTFIQNFFPDAFQLFNQLNEKADLVEYTENWPGFSPASIFQDWAKARQLDFSQQCISELNEHKLWFAQQLEHYQQQVSELNEHKIWFAQQLEYYQQQVSELNEHKIWFAQQLEQAEQELLQARSNLESLQLQVTELQTKSSQTQLELERFRQESERSRRELERLRIQLSEKQHKLTEVRSRLKTKNQKLQEARQTLRQFEETIQAMRNSKFWKLRSILVSFYNNGSDSFSS
jgi:O-antigen biosynthesis protein